MLSMNRLICLTLPLVSLLMTQACVDEKARSDKKELQKQLADEQRESADLLADKAKIEAQKTQLELDAAQDQETIETNKAKIDELNKSEEENRAEIEKLKKANETLKAQADAKAADAADLQKQIDSLNKTLKERDDEIIAKTKEVKTLTDELTTSRSNVDNLTKELNEKKGVITAQEKTLAEKTAKLEQLEAENAVLRSGDLAAALEAQRAEVAKLQKELDATKAQAQTLTDSLDAETKRNEELSANIKALDAALKDLKSQASSVLLFLNHIGNHMLFAVEPSAARKYYSLPDGENCTFIFQFDPKVDYIQGLARSTIPRFNDRTILPLKGGYQRVAVCQKGEEIRAQVEKGAIYQTAPNNDMGSTILMTGREATSCVDVTNEQMQKTPFTGAFQVIYPYRGYISGIESVDLMRPTPGMLRHNMANAIDDFMSANCNEVVNDGIASDLSVLACRLALGQDPQVNVTKGCFQEDVVGGKTVLNFIKR